MQVAYLSSNGAHLDSRSGAISGTQAGSSVTLSVGKLFSSSALSGSFEGSNLLLSIPEPNGSLAAVRFSAGSVAQYNAALVPLRTSAEQASALDQYVQENEVQQQGVTATSVATRPFGVGRGTEVVVSFEPQPQSNASFTEAVVQALAWRQGYWTPLAGFPVGGTYPGALVGMDLARGVTSFGVTSPTGAGDNIPGAVFSDFGGRWHLVNFDFQTGHPSPLVGSPIFGPGLNVTLQQIGFAGECVSKTPYRFDAKKDAFVVVGPTTNNYKSSACGDHG
jgi:hypothetical protein